MGQKIDNLDETRRSEPKKGVGIRAGLLFRFGRNVRISAPERPRRIGQCTH
jgi:hypothetical protein